MSIQIDDGEFTRLHNTIFEKLAVARLTASEYRCLFFLFRTTYGWHKKEDTISLSQWATGTGIATDKRHNVLRTLQGLIDKRVIYAKSNGNNRPMTWGFNKNFATWDASLFDVSVISHDNSNETVITPDSTSVITEDNTSVISPDNKTVISPDNLKRKKESLKKKDTATQHHTALIDVDFGTEPEPPIPEKPLTPQQAMYGAICEALGWDYHVIAEREKVRVAQAVKILSKSDYCVEDIRRFMVEVWFKDWRWEKHRQYPTLEQLRQEIGKLRSIVPAAAPPPKAKGLDSWKRLAANIGATT